MTGAVVGSTATAVAGASAGRMLRTRAREIQHTLEAGAIDDARAELPSLVGRDPSELDESGIAAAVIESVAENTGRRRRRASALGSRAWCTRCGRIPRGQHDGRDGRASLAALRALRMVQRPCRRRRGIRAGSRDGRSRVRCPPRSCRRCAKRRARRRAGASVAERRCRGGRVRRGTRSRAGRHRALRGEGRTSAAVGSRSTAGPGRHRAGCAAGRSCRARACRLPGSCGPRDQPACESAQLVSGIVLPPPGPHGGDAARLAAALGIAPSDVLDLSASLNPCAPDVAALVAAHATAVSRYPDADRATNALADAMNLDPKRVVLTNGGAEAIAMVAAEHPIGRVDEPDFSLYARHLATVDAGAALAFEPAQSDRAPRGVRRARRGVGRGVLSARHWHLDPRRFQRAGRRFPHEAVRLPRSARRVRHRSRRPECRSPARPPTRVVGERTCLRSAARAAGNGRPAGMGAMSQDFAASLSKCSGRQGSQRSRPMPTTCSSPKRRVFVTTSRARACSSGIPIHSAGRREYGSPCQRRTVSSGWLRRSRGGRRERSGG